MMVPCVYILAKERYSTLYVGVTSNLHRRMAEHTLGLFEGFTKRYGIKTLVFYEMHLDMPAAIRREKFVEAMEPSLEVSFDRTDEP